MRAITTVSFPSDMAIIFKNEADKREISFSKLVLMALVDYLSLQADEHAQDAADPEVKQ